MVTGRHTFFTQCLHFLRRHRLGGCFAASGCEIGNGVGNGVGRGVGANVAPNFGRALEPFDPIVHGSVLCFFTYTVKRWFGLAPTIAMQNSEMSRI